MLRFEFEAADRKIYKKLSIFNNESGVECGGNWTFLKVKGQIKEKTQKWFVVTRKIPYIDCYGYRTTYMLIPYPKKRPSKKLVA